jgi:hypothetical protein
MEREMRRLTLFDIAVLVAAAASTMALLRWLWPDILWSNMPLVMRHKVGRRGIVVGLADFATDEYLLLMPTIPIISSALLFLALKSPRPRRWRLVWSRPGTLASLLVATVTLIAYLAPKLAVWFHRGSVGNPPYPVTDWPAALAGVAVFVGWATIGLTGRWRPERSWVDRAGRAVGLMVIAGAFLLGLMRIAFG